MKYIYAIITASLRANLRALLLSKKLNLDLLSLLLLCDFCSLVRHVTARTRMRQFDFDAYDDVGVAKKRHI